MRFYTLWKSRTIKVTKNIKGRFSVVIAVESILSFILHMQEKNNASISYVSFAENHIRREKEVSSKEIKPKRLKWPGEGNLHRGRVVRCRREAERLCTQVHRLFPDLQACTAPPVAPLPSGHQTLKDQFINLRNKGHYNYWISFLHMHLVNSPLSALILPFGWWKERFYHKAHIQDGSLWMDLYISVVLQGQCHFVQTSVLDGSPAITWISTGNVCHFPLGLWYRQYILQNEQHLVDLKGVFWLHSRSRGDWAVTPGFLGVTWCQKNKGKLCCRHWLALTDWILWYNPDLFFLFSSSAADLYSTVISLRWCKGTNNSTKSIYRCRFLTFERSSSSFPKFLYIFPRM